MASPQNVRPPAPAAAEMREVALTVDLLGLKGEMSRASVNWEQTIGGPKCMRMRPRPPIIAF
jgi:hypothetical protein